MAFEATKREWGELYTFFRLLADGYVYGGTPDVKKNEALRLPVAMVQREEHDGTRQYILEKDTVHLKGENIYENVRHTAGAFKIPRHKAGVRLRKDALCALKGRGGWRGRGRASAALCEESGLCPSARSL